MKLTKIQKELTFKQFYWIKKHIVFNTERRTNTTNSFNKGIFKLMINSAYGKTMKNLRKILKLVRLARLVNNEKGFLKYTSRSTRITHKIFDKSYAAIYETKPVLTLNKPIYIGFILNG